MKIFVYKRSHEPSVCYPKLPNNYLLVKNEKIFKSEKIKKKTLDPFFFELNIFLGIIKKYHCSTKSRYFVSILLFS